MQIAQIIGSDISVSLSAASEKRTESKANRGDARKS